MSMFRDLKVLYHLTMSPIRGATHAERLNSFYKGQAKDYDDFRKRLLRGREDLYRSIPVPRGGVWIDMGGGTGSNLEYLGQNLADLAHVEVVDLSSSLLEVARERIAAKGWSNAVAVEADATTYVSSQAPVDVVTFSYSLTMIPNWFAAVDRACDMLKPGGRVGVVDFYVSRKYADASQQRHPWSTRTFWPTWFGFDNVFPSPDHLPYLQYRFRQVQLSEHRAKVPYLPFVRAPYYVFIGEKR